MNGTHIVQKEIKWDAAHRLVQNYPDKCKYVHGHQWISIVELSLRPDRWLNHYGFVKDFNEFKPLKQWIDDNWDHGSLVSVDDESWIEWLKKEKQKYYLFNQNPTSELIAVELYNKASLILDDEFCFVSAIHILETCTSRSIYRPPTKILKD